MCHTLYCTDVFKFRKIVGSFFLKEGVVDLIKFVRQWATARLAPFELVAGAPWWHVSRSDVI
jgi:hypothetical protein